MLACPACLARIKAAKMPEWQPVEEGEPCRFCPVEVEVISPVGF